MQSQARQRGIGDREDRLIFLAACLDECGDAGRPGVFFRRLLAAVRPDTRGSCMAEWIPVPEIRGVGTDATSFEKPTHGGIWQTLG